MTVLLVALAGTLGVLARHGLAAAGGGMWTIAAVNVVGSFLLGLLVTAGAGLPADARVALGAGFLGGFTTFSTFTVQVVAETEGGRPGMAATYLLFSVAAGVVAAAAGYAMGRALS